MPSTPRRRSDDVQAVDPQTHELTAERVENYVRPEVGFLHDMLYLKGEGVRKLMLEVVR
jgi:hypothetical protein